MINYNLQCIYCGSHGKMEMAAWTLHARIVKSSSACVWNIRQIDKYLLFIWLLYQLTLKWPQFFSPSSDDYNIIKYHNKHGHITHSLAHCKNVKRYYRSCNRICCLMGPKLSFVAINNLIMLEWNVTDITDDMWHLWHVSYI